MIDKVTLIIAAIGSLATAGGVILAVRQLNASRKLSKTEFKLNYYQILQSYNDIHSALQRGGKWGNPDEGPKTQDEWNRVERYAGLLEHISYWQQEGLMSFNEIDQVYGHRFALIHRNNAIRQKLLESEDEKDRWVQFERILKRISNRVSFQNTKKYHEDPNISLHKTE